MLYYRNLIRNLAAGVLFVSLGLAIFTLFAVAFGCEGGDPGLVQAEIWTAVVSGLVFVILDITKK